MLRSPTRPLQRSLLIRPLGFRPVLVLASLLAPAFGCSKDEGGRDGPEEVEFGLEARPSNTTCLAPARPPTDFDVELVPAFGSLSFDAPVLLVPHPSTPGRWYVVEQGGDVEVFDEQDTASTVAISQSVETGDSGEGGLLGFAFHPDFDTNGRAFVSYTDGSFSSLTSHVREVTSGDDGQTFTAAAQPILSLPQPYTNHNGGMIAFGHDGYLYIGFGDGGSGGDPLGAGQDTGTWLGKFLRIDVDTGPYSIPADNPFAQTPGEGEPEIYAWGFRNPWRFSFDRETGELWAGDVGQGGWEEIDLVELGGNYGWNEKEGSSCYEAPSPCVGNGWIDPVVEHAHNGYQSITGGYVYRGTDIPEIAGVYVYGDFTSGQIHGVFHDEVTGLPEPRPIAQSGFSISSFGQGNDGEIYVLDYFGGGIERLAAAASVPNTFPQLLSQTGCFDADDPTQPAPGLIPYEINAQLWSDGAEKRRWMALPDGQTIAVDESGDWTFPLGTVLVKEFALGDELLETRLLVLHTDGNWAGYTYEWNEDATDAVLLPAGKSRDVAGQTWQFPNRAECLQCHTSAAGRSLGLETRQLDRRAIYPGNLLADQLNTLEHIGMFATATVERLGALPDPGDGDLPAEPRARAYAHVNCGNCHRPGGTGRGTADFRFETAFAEMGICGVDPQEGDLGVAGAQLLVPGSPALSLISLRMGTLEAARMPAVGSRVVDADGVALVDGWITGIASCP